MAKSDLDVRNFYTDLLKRYDEQALDPALLNIEVTRPGVDQEGYYSRLGEIGEFSRSATRVTQQMSANTQAMKQLAEARKVARSMRDIDLSGITPRYTGGGAPHQTGRAPTSGLPLKSYTRISSEYGPRKSIQGSSPFHTGIDFSAPEGTPIYATHNGIANVGSGGAYGNSVYLKGSGVDTRYAHQSRVAVENGQRVKKGQIIGYVGATGRATGSHLHYEIFVNGKTVNPRGYLGRI